MKGLLCLVLTGLVLNLASGQLKWTRKNDGQTIAPIPRRDPGLGFDATRNLLVLFGGRDEQKNHLSDTWLYNINTGVWRSLTLTVNPPARRSFVYGTAKGVFYIAVGEAKPLLNDVWKFDFESETWQQLPQVPCTTGGKVPEVRYGSGGGIHPNSDRLYVSLGFGDVRYFDTFVYEVKKECWQQVTFHEGSLYNPSYPHARCLHGGTMTNPDELVIFGGCLGGGGVAGPCPIGDTWLLRQENNETSWSEMAYCPIPRIYTTMAMLPSNGNERQAVLYGGIERSDQVIQTHDIPANEVAIFDAVEKTWTLKETQEVETPTKRASAALATSNTGIYMFGGFAGKAHFNDLWELQGDAAQTPSKDGCNRSFFNLIIVHGILMFLGWGVLLQAGAFVARYCKGNKNSSAWFKAHIGLQILGLLVSLGGLVCAILSLEQFKNHFELAHGIIGLIVMLAGCLQPINALIRPHVKDGVRTTGRKVWELFHKNIGRLALILGLINIILGMFLAVIPRPVWIAWLVYCGVIVLAYIIAEARRIRMHHKGEETFPENKSSKPI